MDVTWKIKGSSKLLTDNELIFYIKKGRLKGDTLISNSDLQKYVAIKDTVYSFYLNKKEIINEKK